jgi:hypothetical protein
MKTEIRKYTSNDFETVINLSLRKHDFEECLILLDTTDSKEILTKALQTSVYTWVGLYKGQIECVFGLGELSKSIGIPWFLSTDKFNEFKITFGKQSKQVVQTMLTLYPTLINIIDVRNTDSIHWLEWLGFTIDYYHPVYLKGYPFYQFNMNIGD